MSEPRLLHITPEGLRMVDPWSIIQQGGSVTKLDAIRADLKARNRLGTHWADCWRTHADCREFYLLSLVDDLAAALRAVFERVHYIPVKPMRAARATLARLDKLAEGEEAHDGE